MSLCDGRVPARSATWRDALVKRVPNERVPNRYHSSPREGSGSITSACSASSMAWRRASSPASGSAARTSGKSNSRPTTAATTSVRFASAERWLRRLEIAIRTLPGMASGSRVSTLAISVTKNGLPPVRAWICRTTACRKASTGQSGQQTRRAVQRETVQHDARHAQSCELAQHLCQRSCNFAVAIGGKDQQRSFTDRLSHELQEKQRALVGPVHVFEDKQNGSLPSRSLKDSANRIRDVEPNGFVVRDGRVVEGKSLTQLGQNENRVPRSRAKGAWTLVDPSSASARRASAHGQDRRRPFEITRSTQRTRAPRVFALAANTEQASSCRFLAHRQSARSVRVRGAPIKRTAQL